MPRLSLEGCPAVALHRDKISFTMFETQVSCAGSKLNTYDGFQVVEEYKAALPLYEDFHQKRQLQKLRKLLQDRAALPIADYEPHIVEAVHANPAIVVAGDTGDEVLQPA